MKNILNKKLIERYSRQIVLKDVGPLGQKKIIKSKVLVVGAGGLGCPVIDYLSRAGVGNIGVIDHDKVNTSNIHRPVENLQLRVISPANNDVIKPPLRRLIKQIAKM